MTRSVARACSPEAVAGKLLSVRWCAPGVLQYTEMNFVNSDLLVNVTFSKSKGEIVKRGNGTMLISGLNSDLAKFSVAG